ncbi:hypothetical protein HYU13_01960, partial [Candidatus Woesearchaeota archaeon]|nr:hypothetical protein [Candidatus Woesearchaeota archaeon]
NTLSRKIVSEINFLRPAPELKEASSKRAAGELPDGIDGQGISPNEVYGKRISPKGAYDKKIFPNVIYNKRILSDEQKKAIANLGFRIGEMRSAHTRIIDVALDEAAAVLYGNGNPHDVMIPFAFARSYGAKASARGGEEISGKDLIERVVDGRLKFERIPSLCYFSPHACSSGMADKILGAIKN